MIYNDGRNEVINLLLAGAIFWLETFHLDNLHVNTVAAMLYLNYFCKDNNRASDMCGDNKNLESQNDNLIFGPKLTPVTRKNYCIAAIRNMLSLLKYDTLIQLTMTEVI